MLELERGIPKMNARNTLRSAIRLALLPCLATAGWMPAAATAQESGVADLEEIVVTARKQVENLQSVPVAITAIGADTIEDLGLKDLADISKITAGLVFDNEFSRTSNRPVIRGQANIQGSSGVSYFIDGVYISGSIAAYDLNDIERIEVIKGPQSALYGRNTYSGAINMITKSPGDQFSGNVKLEMAGDQQYELAGTVRGPLVADMLAGSITARYFTLDGAFTNTFDGTPIGEQESKSVSGVLQFTPTGSLDIRLRAYYAELEDGQPPIFATSADENNCYFDRGQLYNGAGRYYCGEIKQHPINSDWRIQAPDATQENDDLQTSLNIRWDINDDWALASITGYNDSEETFITEADYGPTAFQASVLSRFPSPVAGDTVPPFRYAYVGSMIDFTFANDVQTDDLSQELRLEFDGERFDFLLGGYYFDQQVETRDIRELPAGASAIAVQNFNARLTQQQAICAANPLCEFIIPLYGPTIVVPRNVNTLDITNQAIFGLVSFDVTDSFSVTAEARYQEEEIQQKVVLQNLGSPAAAPVKAKETFDSFSPRVTLDWQWSDRNMLYALYAEGTKPGGFNSAVAIQAGLPTYDEEEVSSFEVGFKNVLLDGQLVANLAVFFNEISGYQITQNAQNNQGNTTSAIRNAGDAEIFGGELELSYRPVAVDGLALTLNYAYADPEFTDAVDENQGLLNDVADDGLNNCSLGKQVATLPCSSTNMVFGSIKGNQIPRSAQHQGYFGAELRRPMPPGLGGFDEYMLGADYSYESSKYAQVMNLAETGDTQLLGARVGVINEDWSVTLWGRNLTGEDSLPNILRYADGERDLRRNFAASQRRDTYFGLTVTSSF
jgi:outer membrane receptor protein involved in Fe transport